MLDDVQERGMTSKAWRHVHSCTARVLTANIAYAWMPAGTWKGLTVAVKTILFTEHSVGATSSGAPQHAHALAEAAVALSLSHPNLVGSLTLHG